MIAFVHIPKTAGSTLRTIFRNAYPRTAILNSGNSFHDPDGSVGNVGRLLQADLVTRIEVVLGHTAYGLLRPHLPEDTQYVTLLREPVDRLLSDYHFKIRMSSDSHRVVPTREGPRDLPMPPGVSLEEMLRDGLYLPDNPATRLLCHRSSPFGELTMEHLEQAKENLSRFACVGLTERLGESVALVERLLDRGIVPYESKKVNPLRPSLAETSDELLEQIRDYNGLDIELYEHATLLFDTQVAAAGDELAAEVEAIREVSVGKEAGAASAGLGRQAAAPRANVGKVPLVAFVRVPGAGGATFTSVLERAYTKKGVRNSGNVFRGPDECAARVRRLGEKELPGLRAVFGTTSYGLLRRHLAPDTRYVTLLRDPVERVLAHWETLRGATEHGWFPTRDGAEYLPPPGRDTPLEKILAGSAYLLDDLTTRLLCGLESPFGELPDDALDAAKRNLEDSFLFVGVSERLDEAVALLERALGLPLLPYDQRRTRGGEEVSSELSPAQRELVESHNQLDLELYRFAVELFEAQVAGGGELLAAEAAEIRTISEGRNARDASPTAAERGAAVRSTTYRKAATRFRRGGFRNARRRQIWKQLQPDRPRRGPLTVFVHIPKTAGSTFVSILQNNFAVGSVQAVGNVFKGAGGVDVLPLYRLRESAPTLTYYAYAISGHIPFGVRPYLPSDTRYATLLRDPVERTISHFYFLRDSTWDDDPDGLPPLPSDVSLADVLADGRYLFDNLQTRMLCGDPEPFGDVTLEMLENAKANLEEAVSFGLSERFDESLALLAPKLGLRSLVYESLRVNAERPRGAEVATEEIRLVTEFDRYDVELYRWAADRFEQELARQGVEFAITLAALRAAVSGELASEPPGFDKLGSAELWEALLVLRAEYFEQELELANMRKEVHAARSEVDEMARGVAMAETEAKLVELRQKVDELTRKLEVARERIRRPAR